MQVALVAVCLLHLAGGTVEQRAGALVAWPHSARAQQPGNAGDRLSERRIAQQNSI
jgi:hypothetical protein